MNILKQYADDIKNGEATATQSAQAFVIEELRKAVAEFSKDISNHVEKDFVIALAKMHNQIGGQFDGDYMPIDLVELR